jgi:hypothetical protein
MRLGKSRRLTSHTSEIQWKPLQTLGADVCRGNFGINQERYVLTVYWNGIYSIPRNKILSESSSCSSLELFGKLYDVLNVVTIKFLIPCMY